ncbi:MAG: tetratricopeptide repeat protein [Longimicrobiales bacterium]
MVTTRRLASLVACLTAAVAGQACQSTPEVTTTEGGASSPAGDTAAMPRDPKREMKEARFQEAITGLRFETGLVVVAEPADTEDAILAMEHYAAGLVALEGNRSTGALTRMTLAVRTAPGLAEPYYGLGRALEVKGKTDYAIAAYRTTLVFQPAHVDAQFALAFALAKQGREAEAIGEMERVLRLDPKRGEAHERLAIWHYYRGDHDDAWRHVRAARELGQPLPPQFIALLEAQR